MVSIISGNPASGLPVTYGGKEKDTKPTTWRSAFGNKPIPNMSMFLEADTSTLYLFDIETNDWLPWGQEG